MAKFTGNQWTKVNALLDANERRFGLPKRRTDSVVLASFNIRKIGKVSNKSAGAWDFLRRFCQQCDLIAIQEVQDDLEGLNHLMDLLGSKYGLVASDITGGIAGKRGMVERLAYLFRWDRVERTEVASDITIDRSAVLGTLYEEREDFLAAFKARVDALKKWQTKVNVKLAPWVAAVAKWEARGRPGKKPRKPGRPKKPPFVLPHFLTFIRTPHCVAFRVKGGAGLINITGGEDLTLHDVNEAATLIQKSAHPDANIIFGAVVDETMKDDMRVTVIATGFDKTDEDKMTFASPREEISREQEMTLPLKKVVGGDPIHDGAQRLSPVKKGGLRQLAATIRKESPDSLSNASNFDIPTFLRKHAD